MNRPKENRPEVYRPRPFSSPARGNKIGNGWGNKTRFEKYRENNRGIPPRDKIITEILKLVIQRLETQREEHGHLIEADEDELSKLKRLKAGERLTAAELGYTEHLTKQ